MKKTINKTTLFLLIITAIFAGYFIYKSYSAYKSYQVIQKSEKYMLYIENLNEVLQLIEEELSFSAIYLGLKGKVEFTKLNTLRENTDKMILELKEFTKANHSFSTYEQKLTKLSHNLQYARSRVDVISPDYNSIFFDYYQDEILMSLLNEIADRIKELSLSVEDLQKYIISYIEFVKFRNSINTEKSFISFILSSSKKMSKDDLLIWDSMLRDDIIPKYNHLDKKTISNINNILQPKNFSNLSFTTRVAIAKGVIDANYAIDLTSWLQKEDEKMKRVKLSEETLYKYITKKINSIILSTKDIVFNLSISIFLIFLFLILLFSGKNKKTSSRTSYKKIVSDKAPIQPAKETSSYKTETKNVFSTEMSLDDTQELNSKINLVKTSKSKPLIKKELTAIEDDNIKLFNAKEEFDLIIRPFVGEANTKNIEFTYYIDPDLPTTCIGNIHKIRDVFVNLINHSLSFTQANGAVNVRVDNVAQMKNENAIKFSITDSGTYISNEQKRNIMKVFKTKEINKKETFVGSQSNLIFISNLIFLLDGTFEIVSEPQKGSTLTFALTLKKA